MTLLVLVWPSPLWEGGLAGNRTVGAGSSPARYLVAAAAAAAALGDNDHSTSPVCWFFKVGFVADFRFSFYGHGLGILGLLLLHLLWIMI